MVKTTWNQSNRAKTDFETSAINGANVFVAPQTILYFFPVSRHNLRCFSRGSAIPRSLREIVLCVSDSSPHVRLNCPPPDPFVARTPLPILRSTSSSSSLAA